MRSLSPFVCNTLPVAIEFKTECTSEGISKTLLSLELVKLLSVVNTDVDSLKEFDF